MTDEIAKRLQNITRTAEILDARKWPVVMSDLRALLAELEKYRLAVWLTAAEGTYDEMAVRRAVSPELADLVIAEYAALTVETQKEPRAAGTTRGHRG